MSKIYASPSLGKTFADRRTAIRSQHVNATYRNIAGRNRDVARVWPPCCDVLRHVGRCWLKFENGHIHYGPTTPNMSQHGGQMRITCCAQHCCDMLRSHFAIV